MAYTLSNKCAKNLCKRTVLLQLIIKNVVTFFWNTVYIVSDIKRDIGRKWRFSHTLLLYNNPLGETFRCVFHT